jgi:predicted nucleic-acid-binding protein
MFMDNGCRSLLLDVPTALRPTETAKVFLLNVKGQFLDYLRSIRNGITAARLVVTFQRREKSIGK